MCPKLPYRFHEKVWKNIHLFIHTFTFKLSLLSYWWYTAFFYISNTFKSNARLKLAKNQAKATKGKLLLFENYSYSSSMLSAKNSRLIIRLTQLIIMKMKVKMKNRSRRYDINRPRSKHAHKYSECWKRLSMMIIYTKQHLSNIWSSIHEIFKQQWS